MFDQVKRTNSIGRFCRAFGLRRRRKPVGPRTQLSFQRCLKRLKFPRCHSPRPAARELDDLESVNVPHRFATVAFRPCQDPTNSPSTQHFPDSFDHFSIVPGKSFSFRKFGSVEVGKSANETRVRRRNVYLQKARICDIEEFT